MDNNSGYEILNEAIKQSKESSSVEKEANDINIEINEKGEPTLKN